MPGHGHSQIHGIFHQALNVCKKTKYRDRHDLPQYKFEAFRYVHALCTAHVRPTVHALASSVCRAFKIQHLSILAGDAELACAVSGTPQGVVFSLSNDVS
jgi:hypothetical protein